MISPHLLQTIHTKRSTSANVLLPDVCYNQLVIDAHHILNHNGEVFGNGSRPVAAPPRLKTQTGPHFYDFDELGVWYLYGDSVYHYDKASRVNEAVFSLHFFPTLSMCRLGDSIVYVNKSDINIIYKKKVTKLFTYWPVEKRTTYIFNIALQNKEVLLIATKELLLRYHFSSHTIDTLMNTGPLSIRSLYKYGDYVFAGSYGQGYFCIKGNVIKHMPLDKNKYLRFAHCLRVGSDGICRISTNNGLFCASIKDMLEAYEHNLPEIYYQHLNKQDGMDNNEMNGGCAPCAVTLPDGTTSFPSMEGLVWVRPDMSAILSHSYPITISSIEADGTLYKPAYFENHELPFGTEEAIIHFNYSGWNGTASTYISYQLNDQPFKQWDAATEKVIHLYKPGSGEFNMLLKQLDGFGVNHFSTARIHFRVAYPWYRTFYFYISCLLVLAGVILLSVRLSNHLLVKKKKKLEHLVKEKTTELEYKNEQLLKDSEVNRRVISVINHDILTPLRFMHTTAAEIIKNKLLIPEATKDELIEEISLTGMKLEELAIDILNLMRFQFHGNLVEKESFNLHKSMNDLYLQAKPLLQKKQLSFTNNIPVDTTVFLQKNILRIILYNLVMNAIKFSKQGTITVGCMQNSQQVCITIEDQGIGMSAERIAHITTASYVLPGFDTARKKGVGLGYIIIRDLIKLMKGEMNIDSSSVKGTLIKLTFEN